MKSGNPISANDHRNVGISSETKPEYGPATLNIKVSHGLSDHEVSVPSNSTFGDLKSVIVQKFGLNPETHKLLFRGKDKEDNEELLTAGVKDNSKVLLMEDTTIKQNNNSPAPEEVKTELETNVISIGGEAVAKVREEVDKLAEKVSALQVVVDGGTKVDDKDILYMIEMLMRQLLKLDGIEAEGEGKMQRRTEVRRVQSLVETMDLIKSKNSNPFINAVDKTTSVSTGQWDTFEPGSGNVSAASSPVPLQVSTPVSPHVPNATPLPSHSPTLTPTSYQVPYPTPTSYQVPYPTPTSYQVPYPTPTSYQVPYPTPPSYQVPYPTPISYQDSSPTPFSYHTPNITPFPTHAPTPASPVPTRTPTHVSSPASSPMPSSTKMTQDWEHFD